MSGLDKLFSVAHKQRHGEGVSESDDLYEIAHEIYKESHGCAWGRLSRSMNDLLDGKYRDYGKPGIYRRSDGEESFQEWLDKWYIPKPIGGDGNPISFDNLYDCGCGAIENINVFRCNGEYRYVVTSHDNISFFDMEDLHEQVPDSIEKLRKDICCAIGGCVIGFYRDCDACKDCDVTEFVARAEKLFGGDAE